MHQVSPCVMLTWRDAWMGGAGRRELAWDGMDLSLGCVSGDEQENNGSYFKSKFNPTIQPSNLNFNYLRKRIQKIPAQKLKFRLDGWMVG